MKQNKYKRVIDHLASKNCSEEDIIISLELFNLTM